LKFNSLEDAKLWMIDNQMGRRNLTADQMSYYRGVKYLSHRKSKGGYNNIKSKGQSGPSTSEVIAKAFNISESTVKRDAKFAEGLEIIKQSNPKLKMQILLGEAKVRKGDVQVLAEANNRDKLLIRNEADLHNKAKQIRQNVLENVSLKLKKLEKERGTGEGEVESTIFLGKDDKFRRIKGRILSAINRAIQERDLNAMKELKKLVEQLSIELFN
jgi:hypothetical protein